MTTRFIATFVIALSVSLGHGVLIAQTPPSAEPGSQKYLDPVNGLTLADAIRRAVASEPSFQAAQSEIEAAKAMVRQAALRPNPSASVERREEPTGTDNQTMVQVQWPLDLFKRSSRVALSERQLEATERSVDDRKRLLVADVRVRYGQAAAAARDVDVAARVAASLRQTLDLLRARVNEGAIPALERDQTEVEWRRAEANRLTAEGRAEAAFADLKRSLGLEAQTPIRLRESLESLVGVASSAEATAPPPRTDVREAEARLRLAEAQIARTRDEATADVSVFGSYMRMDQAFPQLGFRSGEPERIRGVFHYAAAGAMVTLPLRNRNQGEIAAAQAARAAAAERLRASRLLVESELAAASAQETQARAALNLMVDAVRLANQNLSVSRQTYELGRGTVAQVLDEQRRYLDVERTYTDMLRAAFEAYTARQRARGDESW